MAYLSVALFFVSVLLFGRGALLLSGGASESGGDEHGAGADLAAEAGKSNDTSSRSAVFTIGLSILLFCVSLVTFGVDYVQPTWRNVSSDTKLLTVQFPGAPTRTTGVHNSTRLTLTRYFGVLEYSLTSYKISEDDNATPSEQLTVYRNTVITELRSMGINCKIVKQSIVDHGPGKAEQLLVLKLTNEKLLHSRLVVEDKALVELLVVEHVPNPFDAEVKK